MSPPLPRVVLADSSVWADHFRRGNARLAGLIESGEMMTHEFVVGELVLGFLTPESPVHALLEKMPRAATASHAEVVAMVQAHSLEGSGIGWVDAHLLASAAISGAAIWTLDKRATSRLGLLA